MPAGPASQASCEAEGIAISDVFNPSEETKARLAALFHTPAYAPGRPIDRSIRMRDMLLALMHCFCMPPMVSGWMSYDFDFFEVGYLPPQLCGDEFMHIMVWDCDAVKVLDLRWDDFGNYRLRPLKTHWWEEKFTDINFWQGKTRWNLRSVPEDIAILDHDMPELPGVSLPYLQKRRTELRQQAKQYAISCMRTCYAAGDRERGDKWASLVAACDFPLAPCTSKDLN
jgi:hypothetical protein